MTKNEALTRLEAADLTPALYRTARRILDRVHEDNGYCRINYPQARLICATDSDETVRGHLSRLASAGLVTVHRNAAIHVDRSPRVQAPGRKTKCRVMSRSIVA